MKRKQHTVGAAEEAPEPQPDDYQYVKITPLGAGQEVGRSCVILQYYGKSVMFDCGIHPGFSGPAQLPSIESLDDLLGGSMEKGVDVILITHFHLDHCAALPYLFNTRLAAAIEKGHTRIFMTHPTKAIYYSLLKDLAKSFKGLPPDRQLFTEAQLEASMDAIEVVDFHQTIEVNDIKITPYRAGHVLGAAMFMVDIRGVRCLYTGDYSRLPDRHLPAAETPEVKPHIVICESTYGVSRHLPRAEREALLLSSIRDTIARGGRVLLPVVALGRAQEVLLMLDEYWKANPDLHGVPIFQASSMMSKALGVYQTYVDSLNDDLKRVFHMRNPFQFQHVEMLKQTHNFEYSGPCVVMATPSGMQNGISREFFEMWCQDARNSCIICDFAVQGTLAREVMGGPSHTMTRDGKKVPLRMTVKNISFSAHADFDQTSEFLDVVAPPHVVLVHGEFTGMQKLQRALLELAEHKGIPRNVYTPKNCTSELLEVPADVCVWARGAVAASPLKEGDLVRGVLVREGFDQALITPDELHHHAKLAKGRISQRQTLAVNMPWSELRLSLEVMFEGTEGAGTLPVVGTSPRRAGQDPQSVTVAGLVHVTYVPGAAAAQPAASGSAAATGGLSGSATGAAAQGSTTGSALGDTPGASAAGASTGSAEPAVPSTSAVPSTAAVQSTAPSTSAARPAGVAAGAAGGWHGPRVVLEWEGGASGDLLADAVVAVILQAVGEPAEAAAAEAARSHARRVNDPHALHAAELRMVAAMMGAQFGPARVDAAAGTVHVQASGRSLVLHPSSRMVECTDADLSRRAERALSRLMTAMHPLTL